ncbi:MAG: hypothetical protein ABSC94_04815 [Polyangiaceae bacterium]|jgi:hypothetical protein
MKLSRLTVRPWTRLGALVFAAVGLATVGVAATETDARADVVFLAPPAPRFETIPARPSPAHFWAPGYWGWGGPRGYVWNGGRWDRERPGYVWARPHWVGAGRGHRFVSGAWHHR